MAPTPTSGATIKNPTHPVVLSDGTNKLGLMLTDSRGNTDIVSTIRRTPFRSTGLKISSKETEYSDQELPFNITHQDDFSGGRGAEKFEKDKSKVADSHRAMTMFSEEVFPGNQEHYTTGHGQVVTEYWMTQTDRVHGTTTFTNTILAAKKFVAPGNLAAFAVQVLVEQLNTPTAEITCTIYTDVAGSPGAVVGALDSITAAQMIHGINSVTFYGFVSVTSGTSYWAVFSCGDTQSRSLVINTTDTTTQKTKRYSGSWALVTGEMYCRVFQYTSKLGANLFTYKSALYCTKGVYLYINGDRGVADVPGTYPLEDATKAWTASEFIGATIIVTRGTGAGQFSQITANGTNYLNFDTTDWVPLDTTSEYVIVGANTWRLVLTFTETPTDAEVAGEFIYFAFGADDLIIRYNCYNLAGVYTERNADENLYANKLLAIFNSGDKRYNLWGSYDDAYHGYGVWRMTVPLFWEALYQDKGEVTNFESPWDDGVNANVTITKPSTDDDAMQIAVAAGHTTGALAAKILDTPVNLTQGTALAFAIKSSVALSAGDLKLLYVNDYMVGLSGMIRPAAALLERTAVSTWVDIEAGRDGGTAFSYALTLTTTEYIYVGGRQPFDFISISLGTTKNAVDSTLSAEYMGSTGLWAAVTINDGTKSGNKTLAATGDVSFTAPYDWQLFTVNGSELYWIRLKVSVNLTPNVDLTEVRIYMDNNTLDLPAMANADQWYWVVLSDTFLQRPFPDDTLIRSFVLYLNADKGAQTITLRGSVRLISTATDYIAVQSKSKINSLTAYGDDTSNPWVVTNDGVFEIQTQNSNSVVPIPLDELRAITSPTLGEAAATGDVYLYFSANKRIERYHERLLENVGPDLDSGLPSGRSGDIKHILAAPGNSIIVSVDGSAQPSVLIRKGGWHELYRAPLYSIAGSRLPITAIYLQAIPGDLARLWVVQAQDILWLEVALSSSEDSADYAFGNSITTPWISNGFLDVSKRFIAVKLYTKNLAATRTIRVFYQVESGDLETSWTEIQDDFDTSPFQSEALSTTYAVSGRRIRFKIMFYNTSPTTRPTLLAWLLSAILSLDVWDTFTLTVRLDDNQVDLQGNQDNTARAETIDARLKTWTASPPTVLTMSCMYSTFDNKTVIVLPYPLRPLKGTTKTGEEFHYAEISLLEVA